MIYVKNDVVFKRFTKQIIALLMVIDEVWTEHAGFSATITSANDSKHMPGSRHYTDDALDLRTFNLSIAQKEIIFEVLKKRLQPLGYDVLLEKKNQAGEHFHIEWDPK